MSYAFVVSKYVEKKCQGGFHLYLLVFPFVYQFYSIIEALVTHSQMEHYFFSYLLTWEVDLIEILEIMAQMWPYVIFLSLNPTKVTSDFILY